MISISTLYCGAELPSHQLRYGRAAGAGAPAVIVYNITGRCNLTCPHCYSDSTTTAGGTELTTPEAMAVLDDLAEAGVAVVLFSGGEPLLREDLFELVARAAALGIRPAVSTNGTLITEQAAGRLAEAGAAYVGVSIDGLEQTHDDFRGQGGAFAAALAGLEHCRRAGLKVGLRMTLTRGNVADLDGVFELIRRRQVPRVCFYHLVPAGRGRALAGQDLSNSRRRHVLDRIMDAAAQLHAVGQATEVLTVDNHADGPYVYLRLLRQDDPRARKTLSLLRVAGGNASGVRLACIRPDGRVLPDQFSDGWVLGNVRQRRWSEIWNDPSNESLQMLRRRPRPVTGRCQDCRWLDVCNGNLRARAQALGGDRWAADPACYLTDEEIAGPRPATETNNR